ncbi:related to phosphatidylinositol phosphate phosphatase [Cephalotrichum gorgonifer]|uniref:Related to phosphatidylinositol phosphate phosphatase n=1 Tax=Cephalotrichum gorgonifer TaxID=2041049 RepID=A0AAE8MRT3_9PEZI|nr:related to phosphatidylinositol phosphate phosphatase [Cephalotrichum gorgonifer]
MDNPTEAGQDASPLRPVSSLLSHFEKMNKTKEAPPQPPPPRSVSPSKPAPPPPPAASRDGKLEHKAAPPRPLAPKPVPPVSTLKPSSQEESPWPRSLSRSATLPHQPADLPRPLRRTPSVMVQPPLSPPKARVMNIDHADHSAFLNPDSIVSPAPASPRAIKISGRAHSPTPDSRLTPRSGGSNPPSPPPPRRSGDFKRETPKPVPPPINRAEKPVIPPKPSASAGAGARQNGHVERARAAQGTSPFSSPPTSPNSSEDEAPPPVPRRPRPQSEYGTSFRAGPPPSYSPAQPERGREPETVSRRRSFIPPQLTGNQRPSIPSRPHVAADPAVRPPPIHSATKPPPPRPPRPNANHPSTDYHHGDGTPAPPASSMSGRIVSTPSRDLPPPPIRSSTKPAPALQRAPSTARPVSSLPPAPVAAPPRAEASAQATSYPDTSRINRQPPYFKQGTYEIPIRYDAKVIDVCGQFVCSVGHLTRVWDVHDGELLASFSHGEGVKGTAAIFKPGASVDEEGARLWIGNNVGDLMEVEVVSQAIMSTKPGAHGRQEIIKIYRHYNELWTLDDGGALHVWGPTDQLTPNLGNHPTQIYRVPKGHTFSMVVGDHLWHATGREIRVFEPSVSGKAKFQVLIRPLMQDSAGEVTAGAIMKSDPDKVFFGHSDGKVSVYSRRDFSCTGVFNVSTHKINSLATVGEYVWAAYNTGRICVYDTSKAPWVIKKEWHAHENPVIKLIADESSAYRVDRMQVISLGADNMIRVWDGLLQDDWLDEKMKAVDVKYCQFQDLRAMIMTWNAGASTPHSLRYSDSDAGFIQGLLQSSGKADILVFGFQELVDLEDKTATAKRFLKVKKKEKKEGSDQERMSHQYRDWRDFLLQSLDDYMPADDIWHLLQTSHMVGLFTCVFVKSTVRDRISDLKNAEVKRGMGGLHGNKGAVIIRFTIDDTSVCLVNCHLAAGQAHANARHTDIAAILDAAILPSERDSTTRQDRYVGGGDGTMILDHELCLLNGDLNYRIDTMSRDTVVMAVKANNLSKLLERDQLLVARRRNPAFRLRAFEELPITFAPTYKYDVGTDTYDTSEKKRSPAWCDRLLYRGREGRVQQMDYKRHEVRVSDHRPVTGRFKFTVKKVDPVRRAEVWAECMVAFEEVRERRLMDEKLHYLMLVIGYDEETSRTLVKATRRVNRSTSRHRE